MSATVGEPGTDQSARQISNGVDRGGHQRRVPDLVGIGGGVIVIVEDSPIVLINDLDPVPVRTKEVSGSMNPSTGAKDRMKQCDHCHRNAIPAQ